jgi:hypothetical protein
MMFHSKCKNNKSYKNALGIKLELRIYFIYYDFNSIHGFTRKNK